MRPETQVVFDGQSLGLIPATNPFPMRVMALLNASTRHNGTYAVSTTAIGGEPISVRAVDAATRVDGLIKNFRTNVLVLDGCQDDIYESDLTAAQVNTAQNNYANARRAAGFDLVVGCTVPSGGWTLIGNSEVERLALNILIRASAAYDAVVDFAAEPLFQTWLNSYWDADTIHLSATGAELAADMVFDTLVGLGL